MQVHNAHEIPKRYVGYFYLTAAFSILSLVFLIAVEVNTSNNVSQQASQAAEMVSVTPAVEMIPSPTAEPAINSKEDLVNTLQQMDSDRSAENLKTNVP